MDSNMEAKRQRQRYRNRVRTNPNPPRPPNSWIIYRQDKDVLFRQSHPHLTNGEISKMIAERWGRETDEVKSIYRERAEEEKRKHELLYPGYRYQPRRRDDITRKPLTRHSMGKMNGFVSDNDSSSSASWYSGDAFLPEKKARLRKRKGFGSKDFFEGDEDEFVSENDSDSEWNEEYGEDEDGIRDSSVSGETVVFSMDEVKRNNAKLLREVNIVKESSALDHRVPNLSPTLDQPTRPFEYPKAQQQQQQEESQELQLPVFAYQRHYQRQQQQDHDQQQEQQQEQPPQQQPHSFIPQRALSTQMPLPYPTASHHPLQPQQQARFLPTSMVYPQQNQAFFLPLRRAFRYPPSLAHFAGSHPHLLQLQLHLQQQQQIFYQQQQQMNLVSSQRSPTLSSATNFSASHNVNIHPKTPPPPPASPEQQMISEDSQNQDKDTKGKKNEASQSSTSGFMAYQAALALSLLKNLG